MTQHDDLLYLGHMLDAARETLDIAEEKTLDDLLNERMLQLAVVHLLQIVGEAARHLSPSAREEMPAVPWNEIIGMRHRIVHDYLNIRMSVVWDAINLHLPVLVEQLEQVVPPEPPE